MVVKTDELLRLMTQISQRIWCASWIRDLEYVLWWDIHRLELRLVTGEEALILRMLAITHKGWWTWTDKGAQFVPLEEWTAMYNIWV